MAIDRREGHFKSNAGTGSAELFYQTWRVKGSRGTLVITHGMSEHSECYAKTAEALAPLGWDIVAWDLRGHGRSSGKRGHVDSFHDFARDLGEILKHFAREGYIASGAKPYALMGHSMGGLITLRHLIDGDPTAPHPAAVALSSPLLGLSVEVPVIKDVAARLLNRVLPSLTMQSELQFEDLSRDPNMQRTYLSDALRHERVSPALYLGMIENMAFVNARAKHVDQTILIQAAGEDRIVSLPATMEFFEKIASEKKKLLVYEESYHEIYNDLDRDQVFKDLNAFLSEMMFEMPEATL